MGRYYFHLRAGDTLTSDEEGTDLPDLMAAQREAQLAARELVANAIKDGKRAIPDALVVADEAGEMLVIPLTMVLPRPFGSFEVLTEGLDQAVASDEEYRAQAAYAEKQARSARNHQDRESWLRIAQGWMSLLHKRP